MLASLFDNSTVVKYNLCMANKIDKEMALALRLAGVTYRGIGIIMGVSYQRIQQILRPPRAVLQLVREKADNKCESCNILLNRGGGDVHHINCKGKTPDNYQEIENLMYLCSSCHRLKHLGPRPRLHSQIEALIEHGRKVGKRPGEVIEGGTLLLTREMKRRASKASEKNRRAQEAERKAERT